MFGSMQEWERDEWRLKLAGIERDVVSMRGELKRLDSVRERLYSEMEATVNLCTGFRRGDPAKKSGQAATTRG